MHSKAMQNFMDVALIGGYQNIVWGTTPSGEDFSFSVDPGTVAAGGVATGTVFKGGDPDVSVTYGVSYGSQCSGPGQVTVGFGLQSQTFQIHTTAGAGSAGVTVGHIGSSYLAGHVSGNNIVWGT